MPAAPSRPRRDMEPVRGPVASRGRSGGSGASAPGSPISGPCSVVRFWTSWRDISSSDDCGSKLGDRLRQGVDRVRQFLDFRLAELIVSLEAVAHPVLVQQDLQLFEPGFDLAVERWILLLQQRSQAIESHPGPINVGLEVPQ